MATPKPFLSALTIGAVGLASKAFLNWFCAETKVIGLERMLGELDRAVRSGRVRESGGGRGVLTISNHVSVLDDPLAWGVFPAAHFLRTRPMRWSLGAADICFTNPLFSAFFTQGQVLKTFRGQGVRQHAVDRAIDLLNNGEWVHVFPEGKIAQPAHHKLRRLKWGIGRMLMEAEQLPTIIPIWLAGFDQIMDESRGFPRFLPRVGKRVSVTFGESDAVEARVGTILRRGVNGSGHNGDNHGGCGISGVTPVERENMMRIEVTRVVQEELERLGRKVSGEVAESVKEGKV